MSQQELLKVINQYNSTDKNIIKNNLKRIMKQHKFKSADIMSLGFQRHNVYSWGNSKAPNAPLFDQALTIACKFDFDVKELLK